MKFIILFFFFLSSLLFANCSSQDIERSDKFYNQANQEPNVINQTVLLEKSLKACYAPEIDSSLLMIRAETTNDVYKKIDYYKKILGVITNFENKEEALNIQNSCNLRLSELYEPIDKEVSNIYRSKVYHLKQKKKSNFRYILYALFSLLILWAFLGFFKKK